MNLLDIDGERATTPDNLSALRTYTQRYSGKLSRTFPLITTSMEVILLMQQRRRLWSRLTSKDDALV